MDTEQLKPEKEMLSVRIPKKMNRRLEEHVQRIGVTKNAYILMLLAKEMNQASSGQ